MMQDVRLWHLVGWLSEGLLSLLWSPCADLTETQLRNPGLMPQDLFFVWQKLSVRLLI